jgi:hypothetical protein
MRTDHNDEHPDSADSSILISFEPDSKVKSERFVQEEKHDRPSMVTE